MKTKSLFIAAAALCASPILHADSITIEGDLEVEETLIVLGDDGVVFKGNGVDFGDWPPILGSGSIPDSSSDVRFMWYPAKGALRYGDPFSHETSENVWADGKIGAGSVAWGSGAEASGVISTAWGYSTKASAWGATVWGETAVASQPLATAWGMASASGYGATAWGESGASNWGATAWGGGSAYNAYSTAWGMYASANGYGSTAWGTSTASGDDSTAWGEATNANSRLSTALGRYNIGGGHATNWVATDPLFEIGIGTDWYEDTANALTVLKNGNVGIGDHQPDELLVVAGDARVEGTFVATTAVRIPPSGDLLMGDFTAGDDPTQ